MHLQSLVSAPILSFRLIFVGLLFFTPLFLPQAGAADNPIESYEEQDAQTAEDNLLAVGTAIDAIQLWLLDANARQSDKEQSLRDAALEVAAVTQAIATTRMRLGEAESELAVLQQTSEQLQSDKLVQRELLIQLVRAAYMAGDRSMLKLLLNQEDISQSGRLLHYYQVFSESQIEKIDAFQDTLNQIAEVNEALAVTASELSQTQESLNQEVLRLDQAKSTREIALATLNTNIEDRHSELDQLQTSRDELQLLIEQINLAIANVPTMADITPFVEQRGKLPLPLDGPILSRFGSSYGEGQLIRQGITIGASEGSPVQAVHAGRVVFTNWLRGSGLLVIVDHGDGYMSLYGSNQALSKQAGDWVKPGDILAISGSGGNAQDNVGIYFEIRRHGEAENPADWLAF